MVKAYPEEFRRDVIAVARKGEAPIRQIAKDFGISETCLQRWLQIADRDDGLSGPKPTVSGGDTAELREARKRIRLLERGTRSCVERRRIWPSRRSQNDLPAGP